MEEIDATLSFNKSDTWSVEHDRRQIIKHNVNPEDIKHDIFWENNMTVKEFYDKYFEEEFKKYNRRQKKDRRYDSYLQKISKGFYESKEKLKELQATGAPYAEQRKLKSVTKTAYSIVVTIGNQKDNPEFKHNGEREEDAKDILKEYMNTFEKRNPGLKMICGAVHCDEGDRFDKDGNLIKTGGNVHLHIIYCPVAQCEFGMKVRNSLTAAYKMQGLDSDKVKDPITGKFETATVKWQNKERDYLKELCKEKGIKIFQTGRSDRHLSVDDYQRAQDQKRLNEKLKEVKEREKQLAQKETAYKKMRNTDPKYKSNLIDGYISVTQRNDTLEQKNEEENKLIRDTWSKYISENKTYWEKYKQDKEELKALLRQQKETKNCDNEKLKKILRDIANRNDMLIIRLFKLIYSLFLRYKLHQAEFQLEQLKKLNDNMKSKAREVVDAGQKLSASLKERNIESILTDMNTWELISGEVDANIESHIEEDFNRDKYQTEEIEKHYKERQEYEDR